MAQATLPKSACDDLAEPRLADRYRAVRQFTKSLCERLCAEDCVIQSMPEASPTRWHLAHTTWFFETFALSCDSNYQVFHPRYNYLFNSYYNTVGRQFPRPERGVLSRPTVGEILAYRQHVDACMEAWLEDGDCDAATAAIVVTGLHHEQQHQELILTDIKHALSCNPLYPAYCDASAMDDEAIGGESGRMTFEEGVRWIGHDGEGFAFDNESPRHRVFVERHELAARLVTNGEFEAFIDDGGYRRPELWLSAGWDRVCAEGWTAPLYWERRDDGWHEFTLSGLQPVRPSVPVCHVSYFEADAFARWCGARLPTEAEWESAAEGVERDGNLVEGGAFHPVSAGADSGGLRQMFGDVWEWTASPYTAYPGYEAPAGALGEYNGKFMCNQFVLRGGSCATPRSHIRATYRNFFPPEARWQFSGIRLAW